MSVFCAQNLDLSYNEHAVLKNINLRSSGAEIIGIIGANGAGKSTLLKAIAGTIPYRGQITLHEHILEKQTRRKRAALCSYAGQAINHTFPFRVEEIVAMGLASQDRFFTPPKTPERIVSILEKLGFEKSIHDYFSELSIGQQQIVMLAQTLLRDTPLILLDEPSAPLDYRHTSKLLGFIKEKAAQGALIFMAVHDLNIASQSCDRIILLQNKSITHDGTPKEILTKDILESAYHISLDSFTHPRTQKTFIGLDL